MKKSLLLASLALMSASSVYAVRDTYKYETIDGIHCENVWLTSRNNNPEGWNQLPFAEMANKARTAVIATVEGEDKIVVGWSKTMEDKNGENVDHAHLVILNIETGEPERVVQMTCDGEPVKGLLCANQVGCDDFGHTWFAGYVATTYDKNTKRLIPLNIYYVKDWTTGECVKAAALTLIEGETEATGRIDYCDLNGDVTREKAPCIVMAAPQADKLWVLGWRCEQGSDEWFGAMEDYVSIALEDTYPADQTWWGTGSIVRIIEPLYNKLDLFYVDGFTTCPSIYDVSGALLDSFAAAPELAPRTGTNGVNEFTIADRYFIVYSLAQYEVNPGCQIRVAELGESISYKGMKSYWELPQNGLGEVSDGGNRIHAISTKAYSETNRVGVKLLTYKCNNGIGIYDIYGDPLVVVGVDDVITNEDTDAPVKFYNLNGVELDGNNLPAGLYITRQGSKTNKVVVK